jgi:membrane fusion protein, copper/silver efflux system
MKKVLLILLSGSLWLACTAPKENNAGDSAQALTSQAELQIATEIKSLYQSAYEQYIKLKDALVATNAEEAKTYAGSLMASLEAVSTLPDDERKSWVETNVKELHAAAEGIMEAEDIKGQRIVFEDLSNHFYEATIEIPFLDEKAYWQYCPMAFNNKGAAWLSTEKQIANPYFGDKMLRCGVVKEEIGQ